MSTLTVPLTDATLKLLRDLAAEQNTSPEAVAAAQLEQTDADAVRLLHWAGTFASDVPNGGRPSDQANGNGRSHPEPTDEPPADPDADPLFRLFGTIKADVTDVSERHDDYIGQALYDELRGTPDVR